MRIATNYWVVGAALGGLVAFVPAAMAQGLSRGTQLVQYNQEEHGAAAKEEGEEEGADAKARGEREGAEAKEQASAKEMMPDMGSMSITSIITTTGIITTSRRLREITTDRKLIRRESHPPASVFDSPPEFWAYWP